MKLDLYKTHKADYAAPRKPVLITLKPAVYLAIEGRGEPGGEVFSDSIGALYGVAYTVKMARKFGGKPDYAICKLEAQWWDMEGPQKSWRWKMLIRTPEFVKARELKEAVDVLLKRGKTPRVKDVALETLKEGRCVQMLHVGPYERERDSIALMHAFAEKQGLAFKGPHHEIYLSDPRRVAPAKLKTILRHPLRKC
jgi:hypothetical protein